MFRFFSKVQHARLSKQKGHSNDAPPPFFWAQVNARMHQHAAWQAKRQAAAEQGRAQAKAAGYPPGSPQALQAARAARAAVGAHPLVKLFSAFKF